MAGGDRARLAALRATALEHRAGRNLAENLVLLATRRRCAPTARPRRAALPVILDGLRECGPRTVTLSKLVAAGDRARQACVGPLVQVGQVRPRSSDH